MIKRTIGRLLLLSLVITGFAGTINDNSVSKAERKYALGLMKETYKEAVKSVKGLSEAQLNYKAAADKWSVRDCIYHIAGAEKLLWTLFENNMKGPANPEKRTEIKVTDEDFVKMIQNRSMKAQAPEPIQPKNTGYTNLEAALADFKNTRAEHIKYMKFSTEDMRNHVVQMPFGWIDCYQLYLMIAAHSNRHTQQINEVKADPGFPAN
ncbi:MAG: DinB family protein [Chitinophagaceae bacterium]|nr:DinB family protein [Chitinophagaceae bacterium]